MVEDRTTPISVLIKDTVAEQEDENAEEKDGSEIDFDLVEVGNQLKIND